jgi:hypothetical protein
MTPSIAREAQNQGDRKPGRESATRGDACRRDGSGGPPARVRDVQVLRPAGRDDVISGQVGLGGCVVLMHAGWSGGDICDTCLSLACYTRLISQPAFDCGPNYSTAASSVYVVERLTRDSQHQQWTGCMSQRSHRVWHSPISS